MFSRIGSHRRDFLRQHLGLVDPHILEIGAFDNATFRKDSGDNVKYLDYFSSDELYNTHRNNPKRNMSRLVSVDYVIKDVLFSDKINEKFDLIVANHVVEHVPDLISWLNQLQSLLRENGKIFLGIPDKNYTFDIHRPLSNWENIVLANQNRRTKPDAFTLASERYYFTRVDLESLWNGTLPPALQPRKSLKTYITNAIEETKEYVDCHCWVFTPESFIDTIKTLNSGEYISLRISRVEKTRPGNNEFWCVLSS